MKVKTQLYCVLIAAIIIASSYAFLDPTRSLLCHRERNMAMSLIDTSKSIKNVPKIATVGISVGLLFASQAMGQDISYKLVSPSFYFHVIFYSSLQIFTILENFHLK